MLLLSSHFTTKRTWKTADLKMSPRDKKKKTPMNEDGSINVTLQGGEKEEKETIEETQKTTEEDNDASNNSKNVDGSGTSPCNCCENDDTNNKEKGTKHKSKKHKKKKKTDKRTKRHSKHRTKRKKKRKSRTKEKKRKHGKKSKRRSGHSVAPSPPLARGPSTTPSAPLARGPSTTPAGRPLDPVDGRTPVTLRTVINWTPEEQDARDSEPGLVPSQIGRYSDMVERLLRLGNPGEPERLRDLISKEEVFYMCMDAQKLFLSQPAMLELAAPVRVVGDTHGHFYDTIRILNKCGFPPLSNYLFLGDYVDHGEHSIENIMLLLAYKLLYPLNFFLLRGHHENVLVNRQLQFKSNCLEHFGSFRVFMAFQEVFNVMPLSAVVGGRIFCVHGGISPKLESLQDLRDIPRPMIPQTPYEISSLIDSKLKRLTAVAHDILWSEPVRTLGGFQENFLRCSNGMAFGEVALAKVMEKLDIDLVVRGHLPVQSGYEFYFDRRLLTLFSAPHFMCVRNNSTGVLSITGDFRCCVEVLKPSRLEFPTREVATNFEKPTTEKPALKT